MGRPVRVLLVNDSRDEREMYAEWFAFKAFTTMEASTAEDALRLAVQLKPDVVVTDIMLPGSMDGLALTASLKADRPTQGLPVPVIILTGCAFTHDEDAANRAGCDRFLTKPCLPEALARSINDLLSRGPIHAYRHERAGGWECR